MSVSVQMDTSRLDDIIKTVPGKREDIVRRAAFHILGNAKIKAPKRTGFLRDNSNVTIDGKTASVNFYAEYAPYVELGTSRMYARPFLYTSVETERQNFIDRLKKELVK